ncbi:polymorphic toxin type 44 domain-containing protein, partial [Desulfovibrio sp. JC022]|uniref:polymorphic toxin type 44 domain-containing protein n=1 Tax=Desulfovibrio sp. JC022 TaxID=2593642 RepID=UPI001DE03B8E
NNANYAQGSAQATTDLNQSGARKGQAVADSANALAAKQAQVTAKEQEKQARRDNAAADKRNAQRRAAIEATSGWSSPLTDTVDPNPQHQKGKQPTNTTTNGKDKSIPVSPEGISVDTNIAKARDFAKKADLLPTVHSRLAKYGYLTYQFAPGMKQDYKTRGRQYEHFGNYNYGAVAKALGISEFEAKFAAGVVQTTTGTARTGWAGTFFDDPVDQKNIGNGYHHKSN